MVLGTLWSHGHMVASSRPVHLIFQVYGVLQVDLRYLLLFGKASQIKGKVERAAEEKSDEDESRILLIPSPCSVVPAYKLFEAHSMAYSSRPNLLSSLTAASPPRLLAHKYATCFCAPAPPWLLAT